MGFLELFKKGERKKEGKAEDIALPWVLLEKEGQIEDIKKESEERLVAIFKHSTRCGISRMAFSMFQKDFDRDWDDKVKVYVLDILSYRSISNEIAVRFQVIHESPQLLLIKKGVTVYHASHHAINAASIEEFI